MALNQKLHVNVRREDDSLWATVEEYPGVFATGDDLEQLRMSLEDGIALVLESPDTARPRVRIERFEQASPDATAHGELIYA